MKFPYDNKVHKVTGDDGSTEDMDMDETNRILAEAASNNVDLASVSFSVKVWYKHDAADPKMGVFFTLTAVELK